MQFRHFCRQFSDCRRSLSGSGSYQKGQWSNFRVWVAFWRLGLGSRVRLHKAAWPVGGLSTVSAGGDPS